MVITSHTNSRPLIASFSDNIFAAELLVRAFVPGALTNARKIGQRAGRTRPLTLWAMGFPTLQEEADLHERVLAADPVASVDVFSALMTPLMAVLRRDLQCDEDQAWDSAIDAVFEYLEAPSVYNAHRGRLSTFVTQVAKRRAIDRIRARSAESRREKEFGTLVELRTPAPKEEMERTLEAQQLWKKVEEVIGDQRDRRALALILDGERSTEALAEVLGLDHLSVPDRRREVKRHRDRLMKVLERFGERLRDDQGA